MSPPLVSLSKKEPLKPEFDEIPVEGIATARIYGGPRCSGCKVVRQRRCRIIACAFTLLIILGVAAALTFTLVKLLHKHRSTWTVPDKAGQTADVVVDDDNKLIHTKHTPANQDQVVVMAILHEYKRHLIAYKDVANQTCYIDRLDETFEVGYERWESYEKNGKRDAKVLKVISDPIEVEVLQHIGDIHIYGHCVSGNSYWVMEIEETEVTSEMRVVYA